MHKQHRKANHTKRINRKQNKIRSTFRLIIIGIALYMVGYFHLVTTINQGVQQVHASVNQYIQNAPDWHCYDTDCSATYDAKKINR